MWKIQEIKILVIQPIIQLNSRLFVWLFSQYISFTEIACFYITI